MIKLKLFIVLIGFLFTTKPLFATSGDTLIVTPNPFDTVTVLQFSISNNDSIWLDVFNVTGNMVKSFYNGTVLSSGTYSINFNGDTLPNGIYFVHLKIGSAQTLTVKLIKVANAVGLKEHNLSQNIQIYPNPTTSIINIRDEQHQLQNSTIEIKNYFGQTIYSAPFTSQIDLQSFSSGMYFLTLEVKDSKRTVKIIKK